MKTHSLWDHALFWLWESWELLQVREDLSQATFIPTISPFCPALEKYWRIVKHWGSCLPGKQELEDRPAPAPPGAGGGRQLFPPLARQERWPYYSQGNSGLNCQGLIIRWSWLVICLAELWGVNRGSWPFEVLGFPSEWGDFCGCHIFMETSLWREVTISSVYLIPNLSLTLICSISKATDII